MSLEGVKLCLRVGDLTLFSRSVWTDRRGYIFHSHHLLDFGPTVPL